MRFIIKGVENGWIITDGEEKVFVFEKKNKETTALILDKVKKYLNHQDSEKLHHPNHPKSNETTEDHDDESCND